MNRIELPYLTSALPGIGGTLRSQPEDFRVEELPAYLPSGTGEHLFLQIEKRDVPADQLLTHLARTLGIAQRDIGTAGIKDRRAVTRQYVSVPARCEERLDQVETENIQVLAAARHGNKLKTGHLRGNRFEIVVRDVHADAAQHAQAISEHVLPVGLPNYYGEQRFGSGGRTAAQGMALLRADAPSPNASPPRDRFRTRLALSAAQSLLFNELLAERLREGTLNRVLPGDVMQVVRSGGTFVAENVDEEQRRYDAGETVVTGPMFGPKMKFPTLDVAQREAAVLQRHGLTPDSFRKFGKLTLGTRRPYLVRVDQLEIDDLGDALRFRFELPSGVYATTVLREFMKLPEE